MSLSHRGRDYWRGISGAIFLWEGGVSVDVHVELSIVQDLLHTTEPKQNKQTKKKLSPLMSRICLCCCLSSFLHFSFLINLWVCLNLAISSVKRTWHIFQCNLLRLIDALRYWQFRRCAVQRCDCWADNSLALPVSTSRCFRNITLQSKNPTQDHLFFFFFF